MARKRGGDGTFPGFGDVQHLGTGRIADVYRAREIGGNRLVALKAFTLPEPSAGAAEEFVEAAGRLVPLTAEPGLLTTFGALVAADGRPTLVLQLCTMPLSDWLRPGLVVPPERAVSLGLRIAAGLDAAHGAGLVHRRVGPENILLTDQGAPVLGDLGEALLHAGGQLDPELFDFVGQYAAPELLEGSVGSPATDVYGLAATLYRLVAGQPPFRSYESESQAAMGLRILRDPIAPIVAEGVPVQLSDLLLWGMSRDPARRPPSAAMLAMYLTRLQEEQRWPRDDVTPQPADTS